MPHCGVSQAWHEAGPPGFVNVPRIQQVLGEGVGTKAAPSLVEPTGLGEAAGKYGSSGEVESRGKGVTFAPGVLKEMIECQRAWSVQRPWGRTWPGISEER